MPARRKIKLVIAYDGTEYHGWQIQPGLRTVQGTLCEAAASLLRRRTHVPDILKARNRMAAGHLVPASGLCLEWIKFRQDDRV